MKRTSIATISGLLCGLLCFGLASSGPEPLPWPAAVQIIISRTLIGFAIGISAVRLGHWVVHGLVMGLLFSLPLAFSGLMAPANPAFSHWELWSLTVLMGMAYGLLIEAITTVAFKARQHTGTVA